MPTRPVPRARRRSTAVVAAVMSVALLAVACGNNDGQTGETSQATSASEDPVAVAQTRRGRRRGRGECRRERARVLPRGLLWCGQGLRRDARSLRAGVHRSQRDRRRRADLGADLVEPREEVVTAAGTVETANGDLAAAQQELVDAQAALAAAVASASSLPVSTRRPRSRRTALVPAATIERVQLAEDDLARAARGINADTPLVEAGTDYNSAALALEIAWLQLLNDAECLSEDRQSDAVAQLTAYTTALQTDLEGAGYDPGPIDGIYGPQTVAAVKQLQTDSGLAVTGFVDEATARALQDKLDALGQQAATGGHADGGAPDDPHADRLLGRPGRRPVDGRADASVDELPDRARGCAHRRG